MCVCVCVCVCVQVLHTLSARGNTGHSSRGKPAESDSRYLAHIYSSSNVKQHFATMHRY